MVGGTKEGCMEEVASGGSLDGGFQETKIGKRWYGDRDWLDWTYSQEVQHRISRDSVKEENQCLLSTN